MYNTLKLNVYLISSTCMLNYLVIVFHHNSFYTKYRLSFTILVLCLLQVVCHVFTLLLGHIKSIYYLHLHTYMMYTINLLLQHNDEIVTWRITKYDLLITYQTINDFVDKHG